MNRQCLSRLAAELAKLPKEEIQAALEFYSEYFDEAGPEHEAEVIAELGSPEQVATQIKADYAVKQMDSPEGQRSPRKGITAAIWVVLGIFAAPIALPLAIGLVALVFSMIVAVGAVAFALMIGLAAVGIGGIAAVIVGLGGLFTSLSASALLIGLGLIVAGICAILCFGVVRLAQGIIRGIIRWARRCIVNRRNRKGEQRDA